MTQVNRLVFPRLLLTVYTLLALSLAMLGGVLALLPWVLLDIAGYALVSVSVLVMLPCAREWISPSYLELGDGAATLKWNNWRLRATVSAFDFRGNKPVRLVLHLTDAETRIEPVGPLFLLASWLTRPVIAAFAAPWWAPLYPVSRAQLGSMLGVSPDGPLTLSFPTRIFGKRRLRRVAQNIVV